MLILDRNLSKNINIGENLIVKQEDSIGGTLVVPYGKNDADAS